MLQGDVSDYLNLLKWYFKAKRLIVVGIKCILLNSCLLFLQSLAILHEMNFHIGIWKDLNLIRSKYAE